MGSGSCTTSSFVNYSNSMGRSVNTRGIVTADSLNKNQSWMLSLSFKNK